MTITLRGFPVSLYRAFAEQSDALLREYVLRLLGDPDATYALNDTARAGAARALVDAALEHANPDDSAGEVDLVVDLGVSPPSDFALLQGVLDDAVRLARSGELLTLPSLPEIVALRNWICEQVITQAVGAEPFPWQPVVAVGDASDAPLAAWDDVVALPPVVAWLVGDDHNRIVAASAAALALLGWTEPDLVGQRIVAVIPPALREAHIAAFTRSTVTGHHRLLDKPLSVPALHRDGHEIPVTLTLSRHDARRGRTVYLARLDPCPVLLD